MLEKVKNLAFGTNIPMIAFILYVGKVLLISASYQDAIVLAIVSGLFGYKMKMDLIKPVKPSDNLKKEVDDIKNALSKVNLASIGTPKRRF